MDDREMLELAAKAAGIADGDVFYDMERDKEWNPLTDDGDRYRLARKLGISIDFADCYAWKRLPGGSLIQEFWGGDSGDEAHAIVRAAAEIGKVMK